MNSPSLFDQNTRNIMYEMISEYQFGDIHYSIVMLLMNIKLLDLLEVEKGQVMKQVFEIHRGQIMESQCENTISERYKSQLRTPENKNCNFFFFNLLKR